LQTALHAKAKELLYFRRTKESKMGVPGSNCRLLR
jgi:hypothetical protein